MWKIIRDGAANLYQCPSPTYATDPVMYMNLFLDTALKTTLFLISKDRSGLVPMSNVGRLRTNSMTFSRTVAQLSRLVYQ